MNQYKLTQSELIARIERRAAAYDDTPMMLRDMLMHDLSFPNDYDPTDTPIDALIAHLDEMLASHANDAIAMPNLFRMNDAYRPLMLEILDMLILLNRESITTMRLADSLCPLHAHDYAICFDDASCLDDDESPDDSPFAYTRECAYIRIIHPSHDT